MHDSPKQEALWQNRYWILETPPPGSALWAFKVVHFRSGGSFDSLQMPSGITLRLITCGCGRVIAEGREHQVAAGDFFCAIPGVLIHFYDIPHTPWEWWEWQLTGPGAMGYLKTLGVGRQQPVAHAAHPAEAIAALQQLFACFADPQRQPFQALALLYEAGLHCMPHSRPIADLPRREELVSRAQALIEAQPAAGMNVNEIARSLRVDRTTLLRAFQECLNCSPLEYLQKRRLDQARELLNATTLPIREIARHTGFRTDKYFIRVFRAANGLTPALWRKRIRSG